MTTYTDSDAEKRLAAVLAEAQAQGEVRIMRADGKEFLVRPVPRGNSPLDVPGIDVRPSADEIIRAVREGRER